MLRASTYLLRAFLVESLKASTSILRAFFVDSLRASIYILRAFLVESLMVSTNNSEGFFPMASTKTLRAFLINPLTFEATS